jgi:D-alanyl-D-alanine carboxypeptidase
MMTDKQFNITCCVMFVAIIVVGLISTKWILSGIDCTLKTSQVDGHQHIYRGQTLIPDDQMDLVVLSKRTSYLDSKVRVDKRVRDQFESMVLAAEKEGICLVALDGYRTYEKQLQLYNSIKDKSKVALPGQSEHQTGLAIDVAACPMKDGTRDDSMARPDLSKDFDQLPEYHWLQVNAIGYGFEQSYTKDNIKITGYPAESWHWKFIINK